MQCQQVDRETVDLDFDRVDPRFILQYLGGGTLVFMNDCANTTLDGGLDK
jgi:hypothetical protein